MHVKKLDMSFLVVNEMQSTKRISQAHIQQV